VVELLATFPRQVQVREMQVLRDLLIQAVVVVVLDLPDLG
jgi:hypothetical protein